MEFVETIDHWLVDPIGQWIAVRTFDVQSVEQIARRRVVQIETRLLWYEVQQILEKNLVNGLFGELSPSGLITSCFLSNCFTHFRPDIFLYSFSAFGHLEWVFNIWPDIRINRHQIASVSPHPRYTGLYWWGRAARLDPSRCSTSTGLSVDKAQPSED